MKIGFLGLCAFGLENLKIMLRQGIDVRFATTKFKVQPHVSDLEIECIDLCREKGVPYLGSVDVNSQEMIDRTSEVDVVIMGGYDKILKEPFINTPRYGVYNTHLGLIPRHRGCYPVVWSVLYDDIAGFTTYKVNAEIDIGPIVYQEKTAITLGQSVKEVYDTLCRMVVDVFPETLQKILSQKWPDIAPEYDMSIYHKMGMPNDRWISWHWKNEFLIRFSRSLTFPPYPGPRTFVDSIADDIELFIVKTEPFDSGDLPGTVLDVRDNLVLVKCGNGRAYCQLRNPDMLEDIKKAAVLESRQGDVHPIPLHYTPPVSEFVS